MPFLSGFNYRKAIKIATAGIPSSSLTAFPKLFMISGDTDIGAELSSQKLAVTLADGTTQVPYGALYFNSSGGSATLKIRAKFDLSSGLSNGDTIGYLYYDDTATDQSNKAGVLESGAVIYAPLDNTPTGSPGDIEDWMGHTVTSYGSPSSMAGQVGNGLACGGAACVYQAQPPTGDLTFRILFKMTGSNPGANRGLFGWGDQTNAASSAYERSLCIDNISGYPSTSLEWYTYNNTDSVRRVLGSVTHDGGWHSAHAIIRSGVQRLFIDGVETGTPLTLSTGGGYNSYAPTPYLRIGAGQGNSVSFSHADEGVDEFQLIDGAGWSDAQIAYDYTDQFSNSSTFTLGAEEAAGGQDTPELRGLFSLRAQSQMQQLLVM